MNLKNNRIMNRRGKTPFQRLRRNTAPSRRATGGGLDKEVKPLTTIDSKVLEMMGKTIVEGHQNVSESPIEMVL